MEKLDSKAVWLFFFQFLKAGLFLAPVMVFAFVGIFSTMQDGKLNLGFLWLIIAFIVVWVAGSYAWAKLYYNLYKFEFGESAFKKERGVIWKKYVSIPYERIQNIDIHRGVIARILGLSDLMIQTAGYSGASYGGRRGVLVRDPEGRLPGLSKERAEEIREELIKRAKGTAQGL